MASSTRTTGGFETPALEWLIERQLDGERRRDLLRRLVRPDLPNLVDVIIADLKYKNSLILLVIVYNLHKPLKKQMQTE